MSNKKSFLQRYKILLLIVICALVLGGFLARRVKNNSQFVELPDPVKRGVLLESVYGIGTVESNKTFSLKLAVASLVKSLYVKEGDQVKKGQKLVELEGVGTFFAPLSGTVTSLPVKINETVFPQSIILTLVDLHDRYVTVSLEQRGALRVRQGQKAKINLESLRDKTFEGTVEAIYSNNGSFFVRIGVDSLLPSILPGMTADVAIVIQQHDNALLAPVAAITDESVYVQREGGKPTLVKVKTGLVDGSQVEIMDDSLREGEKLFVRAGPKS